MNLPMRKEISGTGLILSLSLLMMLIAGCQTTESVVVVAPRFPAPEVGVLQRIQSLNDPAVDRWMVQLSKLCQKLEDDC